MSRLKTLSIFAGMVAMLAVSAVPASAWWQSKQSQGIIRVIRAGEFVVGEGEHRLATKCPVEEVKAQFHIQTKGQLKNHGQESGKQEPTTFGPHLAIQVKSWGKGCTTTVGKNPEGLKTEVEPCSLQLVQQKESLEATGGVISTCIVRIPGLCELQIPAGMEKQPGSNQGINVGLKEITLENVKGGQIDKVNAHTGGLDQKGEFTDGIYANVRKLSANCVLPNLITNAELLGLEFEAEGASAV
jgi:hypothetical protein